MRSGGADYRDKCRTAHVSAAGGVGARADMRPETCRAALLRGRLAGRRSIAARPARPPN